MKKNHLFEYRSENIWKILIKAASKVRKCVLWSMAFMFKICSKFWQHSVPFFVSKNLWYYPHNWDDDSIGVNSATTKKRKKQTLIFQNTTCM
jgi:hypothetical protein